MFNTKVGMKTFFNLCLMIISGKAERVEFDRIHVCEESVLKIATLMAE